MVPCQDAQNILILIRTSLLDVFVFVFSLGHSNQLVFSRSDNSAAEWPPKEATLVEEVEDSPNFWSGLVQSYNSPVEHRFLIGLDRSTNGPLPDCDCKYVSVRTMPPGTEWDMPRGMMNTCCLVCFTLPLVFHATLLHLYPYRFNLTKCYRFCVVFERILCK